MQLLISIFSFLLTLVGWNPQHGVTTLSVSSVDGVQVNSSKAVVNGGDARFECLRSASGRCHYVVFAGGCERKALDGVPAHTCVPAVVDRFVLQAGESRQLHALPGSVRYCMDHQSMPAGPGCSPS